MVSFFDAIDSNKRNSVILIIFAVFLFIAMAWAASFALGLEDFGFWVFFIIGIIYVAITYFAGDQIVLSMSGAKPATAKDYPFLYNIVEGMSIASGIPMPKIYIIDDPSPNAFATGKDPKHASIAVTTGLLKTMKREELEGVVAHEISHIGNYDIRFMLYAVVIVGAISLLGEITFRSLYYGGRGSDRKGGGVLVIFAIIFMVLAPIFSELVRFAISRQREFLADATAAKITRYPEGLASALENLQKGAAAKPLANASDAMAPLYIVNPLANKFGHIFSTHPPIADRVKKLRSM